MSIIHRRAAGLAVALGVCFAPALASPAPAHGGSSQAVTSNYQVSITSVEPATPNLRVSIADVSGTLQLTWSGPGTVQVDGYENEPYLRFSSAGVERNVHSPATYLNQNRYANVSVPATADAKAAPQWEHVSGSHTMRWHDHLTHWMAPVPPAVVQTDPSSTHVIIDRWQVPLLVDGHPVTVNGRLLWVPPPSPTPWIALAVGLGLLLIGLMFCPFRRATACVVAVVGVGAFTVDGFGFLARNHVGMQPWLWAIGWPLVGLAAAAVMIVQLRARRSTLPVAMAVVGLVIAVVGGVDRYDGLTNSQIFSALPEWFARSAAVLSLACGGALVVRYLAELLPMVITGRQQWPGQDAPPPGTAVDPPA
ncbi:MAG: hypothetical protein ABIQ39_03350, partial [Ilumatobacteraceae bacterium]